MNDYAKFIQLFKKKFIRNEIIQELDQSRTPENYLT